MRWSRSWGITGASEDGAVFWAGYHDDHIYQLIEDYNDEYEWVSLVCTAPDGTNELLLRADELTTQEGEALVARILEEGENFDYAAWQMEQLL